jgi:hypothetical protein
MKITIVLFLILYSINLIAQPIKIKDDWQVDVSDNCFMKNRFYLTFSYGLPSQIKKYWNVYEKLGDYKSGNVGPTQLQVEYAVAKKMSVHIFASRLLGNARWVKSFLDSNAQVNIQNIGFYYEAYAFGAGLQPHIFYNKKIDVYLKGQAAYLNFNVSRYSPSRYLPPGKFYQLEIPKNLPQINYYFGVGARYFYRKRIGFSGEAGIGNAQILNIGIVRRFGL